METDLPTGSFKARGALNALLTNMAERALLGVVAASNFSVLATDPTRGLSLSSVAWSTFIFRGGRGD
jgi:hypothetical protein